MLRIANIIEEGKLGGPQIRIVLVADALTDKLETTIIMPKQNSSEFQQKCKDNNLPLQTFHISRITKEWKVALCYLFFSPIEIIKLAHYFKKKDFDLIHASGGSWQYKGVIAGKLAGKKVVWHLNDTSMPMIFRKLFSFFSRFATCFIYASSRSKNYYGTIAKTNKPEFIIPAPVDTSAFKAEVTYQGDKLQISQWKDKIIIGTVANVNPIKGLELFIRSAAKLNESFPNLMFIVIGAIYPRQKRYLTKLQVLCKKLNVKNINFMGSKQDIRPLLQRMDVYVCSSLAESSPIAVWEAMAMEKPVVSTNVGDVPLYIQNGENGYIVEVDDCKAMTEKISSLVNDKQIRRHFGRKAREIVVQKLDIRECANRHFAAYTTITNI